MLRFLFGLAVGVFVVLLLTGQIAGWPDLPGKECFKKFWSVLGPAKAQAHGPLWVGRPRVVDGQLEVTAWGAASLTESQNRAHAVALALRTARHLGYERLAEYLRGARTSGRSDYEGDMLRAAAVATSSAALIRGARVAREEVTELPDGSVRAVVTLRYPLTKPY
jgi:hypothetical protein